VQLNLFHREIQLGIGFVIFSRVAPFYIGVFHFPERNGMELGAMPLR